MSTAAAPWIVGIAVVVFFVIYVLTWIEDERTRKQWEAERDGFEPGVASRVQQQRKQMKAERM